MSLATPKRWPGQVFAVVLSVLMLPFLSVTTAEGLIWPVAWVALLIPWAIEWYVHRSDAKCPACQKPSALRARTFSEDPGLRCRFCGHHHDPETDLAASPLTGSHPPARGLEKMITLFVMCFAVLMLLINLVTDDSGLFGLIPAVILLIGFSRLYGWVPLGSGGSGTGGGAGGGGGGGC